MSKTDNKNFSSIERPYGTFLERDSDETVFSGEESFVGDSQEASSDGTGTISLSENSGGGSTEPAVKSEQSMSDVWIDNFIKSKNWKSKTAGFYLNGETGYIECSNIYISGEIKALTGIIGGFTITPTKLYGGIIQTASTVGSGSTGVIMDTNGLRGYDSILGKTFDLPTDGSAPSFSSGVIEKTIFEINTNAVLRTAETVGDGTASSAGILINNTGLYGCEANQVPADANLKVLINGTISIKGTINAIAGKFGTSTNYWSVGATGLTAVSASTDVIINYGKTDFDQDTTNGFILGYDYSATKSKFEIGSSATKMFKYDGTDLTLTGGSVVGGSIEIGSSNDIFKADSNGIYLGNATFASAPFKIDMEGNGKVNSLQRNDFHWVTLFESVDGYSKTIEGTGEILALGENVNLRTGTTSGNQSYMTKRLSGVYASTSWDKRIKLKTQVRIVSNTSQTIEIFCGQIVGTGKAIGFRIANNVLYAICYDGTHNEEFVIDNSLTAPYDAILEIEYTPATSVTYYIDGSSVGSITVNLPTSTSDANIILGLYVRTNSDALRHIYVNFWDFWTAS